MGNVTPNPNNFTAGAGYLTWDLWTASGKSNAWSRIGDCSAFETTPSADVATKRTGMSAGRQIVAAAVKSSGLEGVVTCSEWAARNLAAAFLGTNRQLVLTAPTSATSATLIGNPALQPGQSGFTGVRGALTALVVKCGTTSPGTVTLVAEVDYHYDPENGEIQILQTSPAFVPGNFVYVSYSGGVAVTAAAGRSSNSILTQPLLYASLRYKSSADQVSGLRTEIYIPRALVSPDGALAWISEDFADLKLKFTCLQDLTSFDPMGNAAPFGWQLDMA